MIFYSFCFLPPEFGLQGGNVTFLEDCPIENLKRYDTLPMIADQYRKYGVHPKVCCPEYIHPQHICTPSDAWCPTYVVSLHIDCLQLRQTCLFLRQPPAPVTDVPSTNPVVLVTLPTMAEKNCAPYGAYAYLPGLGNLTECVPLNRCGKILDNHFAPNNQTQPCGFDTESEMMMICCPPELVTEPQLELRQKPRFPRPDGKPRPVEDKTELCGRWKENDGCAFPDQ